MTVLVTVIAGFTPRDLKLRLLEAPASVRAQRLHDHRLNSFQVLGKGSAGHFAAFLPPAGHAQQDARCLFLERCRQTRAPAGTFCSEDRLSFRQLQAVSWLTHIFAWALSPAASFRWHDLTGVARVVG